MWHWRLQFHPYQSARRWLLTRCAWCGGPSRKGDLVNISRSWDGLRSPWWRGERGLFHHDCDSVEHAHRMCLCMMPVFGPDRSYGTCQTCGGFRAWQQVPDEADQLLAALPEGSRIPAALQPRLDELWAVRRARREAGSQ